MTPNKTRMPGEILELALAKEQTAYSFYDKLLQESKVEFITSLLEQLRDEEGQHVKMIKDKISSLNSGRL